MNTANTRALQAVALWVSWVFCACSGDVQAGAQVEITLAAASSGALSLSDAQNLPVTLTRVLISTASLELIPCEGPPIAALAAPATPDTPALLRFITFAPSRAFAHVEPTSTRLTISSPHDALDGQTTSAGTLRPPPGDYCALRYLIAATRDATANSPAQPATSPSPSLLIEGFVDLPPLQFAFSLHTTAAYDVFLPLSSPLTVQGHTGERVQVTVHHNPNAWLNNISLNTLNTPTDNPKALAERALLNIASACQAQMTYL